MKKINLRRRPILEDEINLPDSLPPLLRRLYLQRGICNAQELERSLKGLVDYKQLSGIGKAVTLIEKVIQQKQQIIIVGDFDADGATSTALMMVALQSMGIHGVDFLVPTRFDNGYGLSVEVVDQAIEKGAELIITVDNGISSHSGIDYAQSKGIRVLVTDHHLPSDILPNADAIINPNLTDCTFPSKSLAGVGVAFYLVIALRSHLQQSGWFDAHNIVAPNLAELLDLVALGTVADVVTLDANNRILVYQGINRIRSGYCRPGIKALLEIAHCNIEQLCASDLGFKLGPRLNAAGRLDNMSIGVELLLCEDISRARELAHDLNLLNETRREIEHGMQEEALVICRQLEQNEAVLPFGLAIYHPEWHQGVVGILASRIKERFHRPVIAFAPAGDGILKGSARSVQGLHMRDVLARLSSCYPELILRFGGHAMAAGLSLHESKFDFFQNCFTELVGELIDVNQLEGIVLSDGELESKELTIETAEMIRRAGPWGQGFPEPLFDGHFRVLQQRLLKEKHLKLLLEPQNGGQLIDAIAFNIDNRYWPDNSIQHVELAYQLDINEYQGKRNVQLIVQYINPL